MQPDEKPDWLSDALARLATGGLATRKLFTDDEEALFDAIVRWWCGGSGAYSIRAFLCIGIASGRLESL